VDRLLLSERLKLKKQLRSPVVSGILERNPLFLRWLEIFAKFIRLLMDRKSSFSIFLSCLFLAAFFLSPVFPSLCLAKTITLGWDANPDPDLEGYVLYRNIESPGPPFEHVDELAEDELENPLNPQVTITGLNEHTRYYVAVTAYDTQGNESYYSDQLCVEIVDSLIESCGVILNTRSSSSESSSSGGGGGAACFIKSAAGDSDQGRVMVGIVVLFGFVLMIKLGSLKAGRLRSYKAGKLLPDFF
jgi:hypothetical protein